MDEKIKDQEVLLVKDPKDENLKAVSGTNEKGALKTVPPTAEHEQSFLKFDKHSNALENFLSNFMRQFKNPTQFHFFKVPFEGAGLRPCQSFGLCRRAEADLSGDSPRENRLGAVLQDGREP